MPIFQKVVPIVNNDQVSDTNPMPVTGTIAVSTGSLATAANQLDEIDLLTAISEALGASPSSSSSSSPSVSETLLRSISESIPTLMETGEVPTFDANLANVFGNSPLRTPAGRIPVEDVPQNLSFKGMLSALNAVFQVAIPPGYSTATIQLSGTWAGTQTFQGSANGGDFITLAVSNAATTGTGGYLTTTTGVGIFRMNTVGLKTLQILMSAYTSGAAMVQVILSPAPGMTGLPYLTGANTNALVQRATTNELSTYDTNIATVLGTTLAVNPQAQRALIAPVAPTLPTTYVSNAFAKSPQIYPRVMVESGGSERLPFAQEQGSNQQLMFDPRCYSLLEQIFIELKTLNLLTAGMPPPNDFQPLM